MQPWGHEVTRRDREADGPSVRTYSPRAFSPVSPAASWRRDRRRYNAHRPAAPDNHTRSGSCGEIPRNPRLTYREYGYSQLDPAIAHVHSGDCVQPTHDNRREPRPQAL